jgi:lipopolysaccharide transport system permease protein
MRARLLALFQARELLFRWTRREFGVRYSQSLLGAAWSILQPLALMLIFSLVFSFFMQVPTNGIPYPVFAYSTLLPWTLFANALSYAIPSLVNNFNLVSRIYFPREILPLAALLVSFIDFLIAGVVFVGLLIFYQIPFSATMLLLPLVILVQMIFTFALILFGAALNVFYRDIRFLIPLALQIWMYLCPVIYPAELVPERFRALYFFNPMATLMESYRRIMFFNQPPDWAYFLLTLALSLLLLVAGYALLQAG